MKPKPKKAGQKITELQECFVCHGTKLISRGYCDRGCCGTFIEQKCYSCSGLGYKKVKYISKLQWVKV